MTPFMKKLIVLSTLLLAVGCNAGNAGGKILPAENQGNGEQSLTRTAESGLLLQANVAKAVYNTEEYTETEEYTDYEQECHTSYEPICHTEQDCHREPGNRECRWVPGQRECRWVPGEQQCRQERICEPDRGERDCEMVRECGTNSRGEEICKDRKVCHDSPPTERCEYREVCESGRDREVCETTPDEQVCEDSPGREICTPREVCDSGPRQVCEDIPVRRTREVTRTRDVFSHYEYTDVVIHFPPGSELQGTETETFEISIDDDDQAVLRQLSGTNKYRIVSNKRIGQQITIVLDFAKQEEEQGSPDIKDVALVRTQKGVSFTFTDHGHRARMKTTFQLVLKDARSKKVATAKGSNSGKELTQRLSITEKLATGAYVFELSVSRDAEGTQKDQSFTKVGNIRLN